MSRRDEIRFGEQGSKSIDLKKLTWFDHEAQRGGGYIDLQKLAGVAPASSDDGISALYDYRGPDGTLVYQVVRKIPKTFLQRRPNDGGGWIWNLTGVQRLPYRLPELLAAPRDTLVYICEGEKDVEALAALGLIATTNPGGTGGGWRDELSEHFVGRHVVILPDNDTPGKKHAEDVRRKLKGVAASVRIVSLPGLPPKGDVSDWLAAGGSGGDLERLASAEAPAVATDSEYGAKVDYRPFKFIQAHTLHGLAIPEREWGVQDWLPIGCVTGNWGDGGTGKTLLSQQLMTSCATGKPWLGISTMRCKTIGIFCEDDEAELHRRQHRINQAYGIEFDDLDDMAWASAVGEDNALVRFDPDGTLHDTIRLREFEQQALSFQARLLVIDTAADTFPDDENKRAAVRAFVSRLNRLAKDTMVAILLNLHPSRSGMSDKGDGDGGSTAWSNTVRCRWSLERPKAVEGEAADHHARILTRRKSNYSAVGETLKLSWSGGALAPVARPSGLAAMSANAGDDAVFMTLLQRVRAEGQNVSGSANAGNYGPKLFARRPDREGATKRDLEAAMQRLFAAGRIKMEEYGRASANGRPTRLAVVEAAPDA